MSQGYPRMTLSCPLRLTTRNVSLVSLSLIQTWIVIWCQMSLALFVVLSVFWAMWGFGSLVSGHLSIGQSVSQCRI